MPAQAKVTGHQRGSNHASRAAMVVATNHAAAESSSDNESYWRSGS
ncbi:MAG: hypothetical protein AAF654_08720 [Myxococcota bacterium]